MKISSVILRTEDVEGLTAFWSDSVGLGVLDAVPGYAFLTTDNDVILTIANVDRHIEDDSWTEIVLSSDDVRNEFAQMSERGVPFEAPLSLVMSRDGMDMVAAHFQDPDGHYGRLSGWVDSE